MYISLSVIALVFCAIAVYLSWRTIQRRKGRPALPLDRYLSVVAVVVLVVGCVLVALKR